MQTLRYKIVLNKILSPFILLALPLGLAAQTSAPAPTYRFITNLGNIDVTLTPAVAPMTVANFISYVNAGAYNASIIHRLVGGFVFQGGGFQLQSGSVITTPTNAPVVNEFNVTNAVGTIAMAKLGTDPNSATSQWFFNLANNGSQLDGQNGGFTVFGNVANAASLKVMNAIGNLPTDDCSGDGGTCAFTYTNSAFTNLPVSNNNYVLVNSIVPLPVLTAPGVVSAASFASNSTTGIAPGEFLAIFGQIGPTSVTSATLTNGAFPTTLAGTQVTFNGKAAPILFTSSGQVNVIAPVSFASLPTVDVVVSYQGQASNTLIFPVKPANPAILTLSATGVGDGAIVQLSGSVVSASSPAAVGDILELFAEGYGVATPATTLPDGAIVGTTFPIPNADPSTWQLLIDGAVVPTLYFGGAPSLVNGVLQVNFKVPQLAPGEHQIQLSVGGRTSPTGVTLATK
jgi:uncharacterized protein (TIGR03437 family)